MQDQRDINLNGKTQAVGNKRKISRQKKDSLQIVKNNINYQRNATRWLQYLKRETFLRKLETLFHIYFVAEFISEK